MKKTLALILMLVMVAFAFASCEKDKKNGDATTAKPATTAEPATTAAPATTTAEPEDTEAPHVHVIPDEWEDEYLVESSTALIAARSLRRRRSLPIPTRTRSSSGP